MIAFYDYFRSSAAYRVRIALNLKGVVTEKKSVNIAEGEQSKVEFRELNPQRLVPVFVQSRKILTQSLAIIEYLNEVYPSPPLLPETSWERARVRSLSQLIASDIHPLLNLRVRNYTNTLWQINEDKWLAWYEHWITEGFQALEKLLMRKNGTRNFSHGNFPTIADICLVPQVYNAMRRSIDLAPFSTIRRIYETCMELSAFRDVSPDA